LCECDGQIWRKATNGPTAERERHVTDVPDGMLDDAVHSIHVDDLTDTLVQL